MTQNKIDTQISDLMFELRTTSSMYLLKLIDFYMAETNVGKTMAINEKYSARHHGDSIMFFGAGLEVGSLSVAEASKDASDAIAENMTGKNDLNLLRAYFHRNYPEDGRGGS